MKIFRPATDLILESGKQLIRPEISYHTFGRFKPEKNNVIWVCHALTANSDVFEWWPGLFGEKDFFNPAEHFIVCSNILGSCYGSTGPLSIDPATGESYYHDFPSLTVKDLVAAQELLRQHLGIEKIHTIIGGSLGGQQLLEWTVQQPGLIDHTVVVASNARHSAWGIAFNESQRMAIEADQTWNTRSPDAGLQGMRVARSIALLSYRHYKTYLTTQTDDDPEKLDHYRAYSYQRYQGEKLARRFNAFSYWTLSKAMDTHHIGRGRGSLEEVLQSIKSKVLVISMENDLLFPPEEQEFIAQNIPGSKRVVIPTIYGHDGFLIETGKISAALNAFYKETGNQGGWFGSQNIKFSQREVDFLPGYPFVN